MAPFPAVLRICAAAVVARAQVVWVMKHGHMGDAFFDRDAADFLLQHTTGYALEKRRKVILSDWSRRLTAAQRDYATTDALASLLCCMALKVPWAQQQSAQLQKLQEEAGNTGSDCGSPRSVLAQPQPPSSFAEFSCEAPEEASFILCPHTGVYFEFLPLGANPMAEELLR